MANHLSIPWRYPRASDHEEAFAHVLSSPLGISPRGFLPTPSGAFFRLHPMIGYPHWSGGTEQSQLVTFPRFARLQGHELLASIAHTVSSALRKWISRKTLSSKSHILAYHAIGDKVRIRLKDCYYKLQVGLSWSERCRGLSPRLNNSATIGW